MFVLSVTCSVCDGLCEPGAFDYYNVEGIICSHDYLQTMFEKEDWKNDALFYAYHNNQGIERHQCMCCKRWVEIGAIDAVGVDENFEVCIQCFNNNIE